jgi:hypothetical protein
VTLVQAIALGERRGLGAQVLASYRQIKPWWAFWVREDDAALLALEDWDLIERDDVDRL